jgi:hypothetical protein
MRPLTPLSGSDVPRGVAADGQKRLPELRVTRPSPKPALPEGSGPVKPATAESSAADSSVIPAGFQELLNQ